MYDKDRIGVDGMKEKKPFYYDGSGNVKVEVASVNKRSTKICKETRTYISGNPYNMARPSTALQK